LRRTHLAAANDDVWRLRIGDYRILYRIEDDRLVVLVIRIGHRREVYRR
jgi:mRNA interferase RelE/StbE